jgi:hypothetical protein
METIPEYDNGTVDTAGHRIFEGKVRNGEHGVINGRNVRRKNHCGEDNVESNCSTGEHTSEYGKQRMGM